jgi:hypothetical protein
MPERSLRTEVGVKQIGCPLSLAKPVMLMGSCFSQHMGERLSQSGYSAMRDPFGLSFNPLTISRGIQDIVAHRQITEKELIQQDELWHHLDFHSSFSGLNRSEACVRINQSLNAASEQLKHTSHIVITLGTSWVFDWAAEPGQTVNNCHRIPAAKFTRRLSAIDEVVTALNSAIEAVLKIDQYKSIILVLSPVRHWRDGAEENSISKATLRLAIAELCESRSQCCYFPSYEIMMDELRDYRFYADDFLHPNTLAQDIIWNRFSEAAFTQEDRLISTEIERYYKARNHRHRFPESAAAQKGNTLLDNQRLDLLARFPFIKLD